MGEEGKGRDGTVQYVVSGSGKVEGRRQKRGDSSTGREGRGGGGTVRRECERPTTSTVLSCTYRPRWYSQPNFRQLPIPRVAVVAYAVRNPEGGVRSRGLSLIHINLIHAVLRNVPPPHLYVPPAVSGYAVT